MNKTLKKMGRIALEACSKVGYVPDPYQIAIEITEKCNLSCSTCPRKMGVDNRDMSVENYKKILSKFKNLKKVSLVGRGETFSHPQIWEILDASMHIKTVSITTNGMALNEFGNTERLEGYKNIELVISCDDVHKKYWGPNSFINKQSVVIQSMITPNLDIREVLLRADYVGAKKVNLFYPIGFYNSVFPRKNLEKEIKEKWPFEIRIPPKEPTRSKCFSPFFKLRIAIDGTVYPCCYIYNAPKEWNENWDRLNISPPQQNYIMGDILTESLEQIWRSGMYKNLRKKILSIPTGQTISRGMYNKSRHNVMCKDNKEWFDYCDICLHKWGMAC